MLLPLLGICALFGRFWGKSWEPVQGLLTDGCGCGDPRCCGNLFILCLFLFWQIRQRFRGPKNPATKKKGPEVSLLKWAVPPWYRLAIPVPSPGLSICPCTQKRLEIHVQKLVHRQKWGPPQKLRESWAQFLLSQLSGHTGLEKSGEPGICSPLFPSTSPETTPCHSLLPGEGPRMLVDQLVEEPEAQEPERDHQQLARDEDTLTTQALGVEEGLLAGDDVSEVGSQTNCLGGESPTYKDSSFPWGPALEDTASQASEQELEATEGSSDTTPLTQPLVRIWEGLQSPGRKESLQDIHEDFPGRGNGAGGGTGLVSGQHQHQCGQAGGTALELSHHDTPLPGWSQESQTLNPLPLLAIPLEDSDCAALPSDTDSKEITSTHVMPPKQPTLKKSSRLLLESLMRRKIAHLKWGLPRRIQESEWLFQLMGPSSPSDAGMQCSSTEEEETKKEESRIQESKPTLGETATQSSCMAGGHPACRGLNLPKAANGTADPVLQPVIQFKERLKCQEKEAQELPVPPRKKKGKNDPGCPDTRGLSISLDGAKGPKQSPNLWELQDLCDEALSRAMLPVTVDCAYGGTPGEQIGFSTRDSPSAKARKWKDSQEAAEEAFPRNRGSSSEPMPGPSNSDHEVFEKLGSPGAGAGMMPWPQDPCKKELNPKVFQDSQALPWAMVCHWSMPSASQLQNISDSGGDTPQSHSSEAHLLPEQRKRIFWSQGGKMPEPGASSNSPGRTKGPLRAVALRLGTAFMNKMLWSPRQASSATSVSNHKQCQEDPDLSGIGSSEISQAGLPGRSWDTEEAKGSDHRGFTRGYASVDLERDSLSSDGSFCDNGTGESSAQTTQSEQIPTKSSWVKRLRGLLTRLNFNK
ncbi:uncharacterized protein [Notamacropus eugenii]|uniref:uncharacterized protein isoform X2 n=1 Tax=Notamacropus eugenii TaxID=9315 RepID=UPI003B68243F